jgi:signal transduction histidine kinase
VPHTLACETSATDPIEPAKVHNLSGQDHAQQTIEALRQANAVLELKLAAAELDCQRCQAARLGAQRLETLGHLAGGMAHDFGNVLEAVLAVASLLKRHPGDRDRVLRQAAMLEKATARGTAITSRLLAYGRTGEIGIEAVDPKALLPHVRESLQPTMLDVTIAVEISPGVPQLMTDRGQLEMTLINLANNARDAMIGLPGRMTLSATWVPAIPQCSVPNAPDGFVCFAVRDSGVGMDAKTAARATEPFFTTKPPDKGTGLGLALAFRFCRQSRGALTIDSVPGAGTTIRMYLPAGEAMPQEMAAVSDLAATQFPIPGPVAILLQAEPVVRDGLRIALLARGFRVRDADQAESGAGPVPDLLVADLSPDQHDGPHMIRAWRQRMPRLPVVVLMDDAATSDFAQDRAVVRLVNPVSPSDLATAAVRILAEAGQYITSPPFGDKVAPT